MARIHAPILERSFIDDVCMLLCWDRRYITGYDSLGRHTLLLLLLHSTASPEDTKSYATDKSKLWFRIDGRQVNKTTAVVEEEYLVYV